MSSHGLSHTESHANDLKTQYTASHPPDHKPDPTLNADHGAAQGGLAAATPTGYLCLRADAVAQQPANSASTSQLPPTVELEKLTTHLKRALRQFPDFPAPGILFEDILPIFANPSLHESLIHALELHCSKLSQKPDVIVGLDARGFLFGPSLALRLGAAFVPVRKRGKLPGPCETASFRKEYGEDFFQMQGDAVKAGQKVLVVDDIIATGSCTRAVVAVTMKALLACHQY
jgi:adenine phosphoribosyltransferase